MKKIVMMILLVLTPILNGGSALAAHQTGDPDLIRIKGSDTLFGLARLWADAYHTLSPEIPLSVGRGGSGNGIAALINNHVEIANTSRPLKKREFRLLKKLTEKDPLSHVVGWDAVSILVHPHNPLNGISLGQLTQIYGKYGRISHWTDLGITIPGCKNQAILRTSRKNNSGTYGFFNQAILTKRSHFHPDMEHLIDSKSLVKKVSDEPCAIGYSSMAFVTTSVKTLCIAKSKVNSDCIPPTIAFTLDKSYPLARPLYMITQETPNESVKNYLKWIMGPDGQEILRRFGFIPIPKGSD